jgi:hypothetical protein
LEQGDHAEARDLAMLGRRRLRLGHRIVANALAHRGQDLIRAPSRSRDEKDVAEAGFVAAILLGQLNKHFVVRGSNSALLAL